MTDKIQVYLAGSMFCEADRMYNAYLADKIREAVGKYIDLYVPQENKDINDKTKWDGVSVLVPVFRQI